MRINQNVMAYNASRNLASTNVTLGKSLEKLSSGFRINRAADDAAGLVISQGLRAQVTGLRQATRNAQDGISVVQTAEGALNEVHTMLNRMRELAVQASNTGANDQAARDATQTELAALRDEINHIAESTKFGSVSLLDGSYGVSAGQLSSFDADGDVAFTAGDTFTVSVAGGSGAVSVALNAGTFSGADAASALESAIKSALQGTGNAVDAAAASRFSVGFESVGAGGVLTVSNGASGAVTIADGTGTPLADNTLNSLIGVVAAGSGSGGVFQVGANSGDDLALAISDLRTATVGGKLHGIDAIDVSTGTGATAAIAALDTAITEVSGVRGDLGALQNRFESMINNLQVTSENLAASESRIRDTDMAAEMVSFTRSQVLMQAGTAMLAQANQVPQSILSLLR